MSDKVALLTVLAPDATLRTNDAQPLTYGEPALALTASRIDIGLFPMLDFSLVIMPDGTPGNPNSMYLPLMM